VASLHGDMDKNRGSIQIRAIKNGNGKKIIKSLPRNGLPCPRRVPWECKWKVIPKGNSKPYPINSQIWNKPERSLMVPIRKFGLRTLG